MPITVTPTDYLPGILFKTVDGDGEIKSLTIGKKYILIDKADLPLSADADDASISRTLFAVLDGIRVGYEAQLALDAAPANWTYTRSTGFNDSTDVMTRSFTAQFNTEVSGEEVIAEV